jgi:hypothetical protein
VDMLMMRSRGPPTLVLVPGVVLQRKRGNKKRDSGSSRTIKPLFKFKYFFGFLIVTMSFTRKGLDQDCIS